MISGKCPVCTRRPFWAAPRRPNILKVFWIFQGVAKKQGKTSAFWLSHVRFFFFYIVSSWSPVVLTDLLACKCVIHPCFLTFHFFILLSDGCVSLFLFIFIFLVFITFHLLVCLSCFLSWCDRNPDQIRKYLQILIVIFCFGASIPTLSLGPDNNPTRPREEPLKKNCFLLPLCLVY